MTIILNLHFKSRKLLQILQYQFLVSKSVATLIPPLTNISCKLYMVTLLSALYVINILVIYYMYHICMSDLFQENYESDQCIYIRELIVSLYLC